MWQQRAHMPPATGNGSNSSGGGGWGQQQQQQSAAAAAAAAGYHRARGGGEDERGGPWAARTWSGERGDAAGEDGDDEDEDEVAWSASEQACLRKSVKENGLDDWTLGDWSEVAAAVGGGKTPEQCFNRWHAEATLAQQRHAQQGQQSDDHDHAGYSRQQQHHHHWDHHNHADGASAGSQHGGRPRLPPPPGVAEHHRMHAPSSGQPWGPQHAGGAGGGAGPSGHYDSRPYAREPDVQPGLSGWPKGPGRGGGPYGGGPYGASSDRHQSGARSGGGVPCPVWRGGVAAGPGGPRPGGRGRGSMPCATSLFWRDG